jgi:hypothetical protein
MEQKRKLSKNKIISIGLLIGSLTSVIILMIATRLSTPGYWTFFVCLSAIFVTTLTLLIYPHIPDLDIKRIFLFARKQRSAKFEMINMKLKEINKKLKNVGKTSIQNPEKNFKRQIAELKRENKRLRKIKENNTTKTQEIVSLWAKITKKTKNPAEEELTQEMSIENKQSLEESLKKRYPQLPEEPSNRVELERFIARLIQQEKKKFSISQILSSIIKNYPIADPIRNKISTELKKWISEDQFIRQVCVNEGVKYYKII